MNSVIKFKSVKPDLPSVDEIIPYLERISRAGIFTNYGPMAREFESIILNDYGFPEECCISCANATAGLSAALMAFQGEGHCIVPAFTFPASLGAVHAAGMSPVVVDVDPNTWAMSYERLYAALTYSNVRCVMLVHPFGMDMDFEQHIELCRKHNASIIIDNAAGLGNLRRYKGDDVIEVFSLHATKPFGVGEGGVIFAPRSKASMLRAVMNFGLNGPNACALPWGFNGKLSEFHAAVGIVQCARMPSIIEERKEYVSHYVSVVQSLGVQCPKTADMSPWQIFPILLPHECVADSFVARCAADGVEIRRYYRPSLSQIPQVAVLGDCAISESLSQCMCALPVRKVSDHDSNEILNIVSDALKENV